MYRGRILSDVHDFHTGKHSSQQHCVGVVIGSLMGARTYLAGGTMRS